MKMGIRLALGATPAGVRRTVVQRGMLLGAIGLGLVTLAGAALGRVLQHSVRGVSGSHLVGYAGAIAALLDVTFSASLSRLRAVPAWRASRIHSAM